MSLWNSSGRSNRLSFIPRWSVQGWQKMGGLTGTAFSRELPLWWTSTVALCNKAGWCHHSEMIWKNPADQYVLISICCFGCVKRCGISQVQRVQGGPWHCCHPVSLGCLLGDMEAWELLAAHVSTSVSCQIKCDWEFFLEIGSQSHRQRLADLRLLLVPAPPSFSPSVFCSHVVACSICLPLLLLCFLLASL